MNEPTTTLTGNLVDDPALRYTPNGAAVCNFKVAQTPRTYDRQANEWKDGDALFMPCTIWREAAENAAESLTKGVRVIVTGRLKQRSYETKEGDKRTVVEMDVDEIGPSLRYATANVNRTQRQNNGGNSGRNYDATSGQGGWGQGGGDPWASGGQTQQGFSGTAEEPPF